MSQQNLLGSASKRSLANGQQTPTTNTTSTGLHDNLYHPIEVLENGVDPTTHVQKYVPYFEMLIELYYNYKPSVFCDFVNLVCLVLVREKKTRCWVKVGGWRLMFGEELDGRMLFFSSWRVRSRAKKTRCWVKVGRRPMLGEVDGQMLREGFGRGQRLKDVELRLGEEVRMGAMLKVEANSL